MKSAYHGPTARNDGGAITHSTRSASWAAIREGVQRSDGHGRHQQPGVPAAHDVERHPHGGAGGHAVVDHDHGPALQRLRLPAAPQLPGPARQVGRVAAGQRGHVVPAQPGRRHDAGVERHPPVVGHRRQCQLLVTRDADLAHHQHVQGGPERGRNLGRHRHAAPGQPQHDRALAREVGQQRRQAAPRVAAIGELGGHGQGLPIVLTPDTPRQP